jgi:hypothetical protein
MENQVLFLFQDMSLIDCEFKHKEFLSPSIITTYSSEHSAYTQ